MTTGPWPKSRYCRMQQRSLKDGLASSRRLPCFVLGCLLCFGEDSEAVEPLKKHCQLGEVSEAGSFLSSDFLGIPASFSSFPECLHRALRL